jgi:hypothetical protein
MKSSIAQEPAIQVDPKVEASSENMVDEKSPSEQLVESDWSSEQEVKLKRK